MKKVVRIGLIILMLSLFAVTLIYLKRKSMEKPVVYQIVQASQNTIVKKTVATGKVQPENEIEIKPNVSGIVEKLFVEPGDLVQVGDLIAKIKIIPNVASLNNAENRLNQAKIALKNAKRQLNRSQSLFENKVVSQQQLELDELAFKQAKQELEGAQNALQIIQKGSASKLGKSNNTLIKSTIAGMVLDVPVEKGNSVIEANNFNPGTTIAFVADMGEMIFDGKVDESEVGKLTLGMDIILTIGAIENETFKGKLKYIAPKGVLDQGAVQFQVKASIKQKENVFIRAGYSANADIVLEKRENVWAIPESILHFESNKTYVFEELAEQEFKKKEVVLGLSNGIMVEVIQGIDSSHRLRGNPIP
ncbi:MAG: efflux RND transporter periplasmic adaptor subunit [Bacteroidota bacterium]|nr:efflux RND transporter periplasmic adaptor subunit [Bacteroidota bacterium]